MDSPYGSPGIVTFLPKVADDASPKFAGGRRPGKIWSAEAREDMFRRREAGEPWESICLDHPNRSRHAMQQQFSMMKKQQALADGTWTENRRGRKRKHANGDKKTSLKRKEPWYVDDDEHDAAEEDDSSNGFYAEHDDEDLASTPEVNHSGDNTSEARAQSIHRPPVPARSSTDPMARLIRTKPGPVLLSHIAPQLSVPESRNLAVNEADWRAIEANGTYSKKRKLETDPNAPPRTAGTPSSTTTPVPIAAAPTLVAIAPSIPPPCSTNTNTNTGSTNFQDLLGITFDERRLREIIQEGRLRARDAALMVESERASLRQTFDASVSRANRRAHEADEKLRWTQLQHGDALKVRDHENEDKLQQLRERLVDAATRRGDVHFEEVHALKRTIDSQMEEREDLERENTELRKELEALRSIGPRPAEGSEVEDSKRSAESKNEIRRTARASSPRPLPSVPSPVDAAVDPAADALTHSFAEVMAFMGRLRHELDDMSMRAIVHDVGVLAWKMDAANALLEEWRSMTAQRRAGSAVVIDVEERRSRRRDDERSDEKQNDRKEEKVEERREQTMGSRAEPWLESKTEPRMESRTESRMEHRTDNREEKRDNMEGQDKRDPPEERRLLDDLRGSARSLDLHQIDQGSTTTYPGQLNPMASSPLEETRSMEVQMVERRSVLGPVVNGNGERTPDKVLSEGRATTANGHS